ncbi:MAG: DegV family protein [Eubacteriales bacterium]|nr:DegV family protein [Eubacteriales bacterium]
MEKICIFTDSAADLTHEEAERWQIEIAPLRVTVEGKTYLEYYEISPEEYWKLLMESKDFPQTSQVSMESFLNIYKKAKEDGCTHVIGVLINSKGSGTYQAACITRDMFYDEYGKDMVIELIDSLCYSYTYGKVAVAGAKMREEGKPFAEILAEMNSLMRGMKAYVGIYNLRILRKSGRISGGAAFVGDALGLRPLAVVFNGAVDVMCKVRGDKAVVTKLVELAAKDAVDKERQIAHIAHGAVPEEQIAALERKLLEAGFAGVERGPLGVMVTSNTGPQALGVIFRGAPRA